MGVRIVHIPTGIVSECREHRSQGQNKREAMKRMASMLKEHHIREERKKFAKDIVKEVIRSYNTVENRVKDHASGYEESWSQVYDDVSKMIEARMRGLHETGG